MNEASLRLFEKEKEKKKDRHLKTEKNISDTMTLLIVYLQEYMTTIEEKRL